jgi:hypothetical protein
VNLRLNKKAFALEIIEKGKGRWSGRPDLNWGLPAPKLSAPILQPIRKTPILYIIQVVRPFNRVRLVDVISSNRV